MLTALSAAALYAASVFYPARLGLTAVAALFCIAAVVETGLKGGVAVYVCALILGLLLTADKTPMILYGFFFGYYPIVKSLAERCESRVVEWIIKLAVMNAALTVIILLFRSLVFSLQSVTESIPLIYIAVNIVYVVFDFGVSKLIWFYIEKIHKRSGRKY